jgi:hypothetical protein
MKNKWPLFAGILLLTAGIVVKIVTEIDLLGLLLIVAGASLKLYYIAKKIIVGVYKPGYEVLLLINGLFLLFFRNYLHLLINAVPATLFMAIGISFKITFIILFIRKTKLQLKAVEQEIE